MNVIIKSFHSLQAYQETWENMRAFTNARTESTPDEIWLLEHPAVFTQGLGGKAEHLIKPHDIPIVQTDRGGQVTYHGPGQLMIYLLLDLNRLDLSTRLFVRAIEQIIVRYLTDKGISSQGKVEAPGVYVGEAKICSIGLRVRRGYSYHGLALNVAMDLSPFTFINPCGFKNLAMTQIQHFIETIDCSTVRHDIIPYLVSGFGYNQFSMLTQPAEEWETQ